MRIDSETLEEIRAVLRRDCVIEVTVTFYDNSDDRPLEPVDIASTLEFEAGTPLEDMQPEFRDMLTTLQDVFAKVDDPQGVPEEPPAGQS
jgi:hypothetical protein